MNEKGRQWKPINIVLIMYREIENAVLYAVFAVQSGSPSRVAGKDG